MNMHGKAAREPSALRRGARWAVVGGCWPLPCLADPVVAPSSAAQAMDWGRWLLEILAIVVVGKFLFFLAGLVFLGLHVALLAMLAWGLVKRRVWRAGVVFCVASLLLGYGGLAFVLRPHPGPDPSSDWRVVEQGLALDLHPVAARWEVFSTPEEDDWLAAPTDMQTLVAELTLSQADVARWSAGASSTAIDQADPVDFVVAPNSARHWLTPDHRGLLARLATSEGRLDAASVGCRSIAVRGLHSQEDKRAFLCVRGDGALLHVVLSSS